MLKKTPYKPCAKQAKRLQNLVDKQEMIAAALKTLIMKTLWAVTIMVLIPMNQKPI